MKSYVANGTGSQQTLTESQDNKIPVYDSVADAESDLANLAENQIIAMHDTGSELSAPVDVAQSGNMHAVTSNAVAVKLNTVSDIITMKDDATATVLMRTYNKIAIIDVYMKIAGQTGIDITPYGILPMGNGAKTPLTWERQIRGEAYLNNLGQLNLDTMNSAGGGSGQLIVFLA